VAAARVFPLKDIEMMIRSAAVARDLMPDVQYLVYGSLDADIPYVERCRALIAELGLEEVFTFAGHHSKPADLYNEGDISALSSISEGFPYTVLESMACARPVVATDVGGVREALEGYGILVPPRDHVAFGEAVVTLLADPDLRARLGRQAREAVLARFRTAHSVDGYRRFYADALARRAPAAA
jgi:glycosyltransferase involved in cell wall biosynthesis